MDRSNPSSKFTVHARVKLSHEAREKLIDPRRDHLVGEVVKISGPIVTVSWGEYRDDYLESYLAQVYHA